MHNGEVLCLVTGVARDGGVTEGVTDGGYLVSGGADFQVRSWTLEGEAVGASGHNHAPVQCLLAVQPPPGSSGGGSGGAGGVVWCGAGDGLVSVWRDPDGSGRLDQGWQELPPEGQKGACSLLLVPGTAGRSGGSSSGRSPASASADAVWVGCSDGRVLMYGVGGGRLLGAARVQAGPVQVMACVGRQVRRVCAVGWACGRAWKYWPLMCVEVLAVDVRGSIGR
jgi:hypothetical protein